MGLLPRATRRTILMREAAQAEIIAILAGQGQLDVADRLATCQARRIATTAPTGWRWRCRNPGCLACWRGELGNWWRSFQTWSSDDPSAFVVMLPIDVEQLAAPIGRALRDARDREARKDRAWADVACCGLVDGRRTLVMVSPWLVRPTTVMTVLGRLWPTAELCDPSCRPERLVHPYARAALAIRGRGSEPLRFTVLPQAAKPDNDADAVVPVVLVDRRLHSWAPIDYGKY